MRIPQIQALRAVAALLVVIYHAHAIPGGYIGVDIFYVISGFLITGLLLRELENNGRLNLKAFYTRRVKRLLPTSFTVLFFTAITAWALYPKTMRHDLGRDLAAAAGYISNYLFAAWQMDYQNLDATPPVVIHYWSLAVEEQFYLFWPFIIYALFRLGKRRAVLVGATAITLASFLLSLFLTERSPIWSFYSLPTRAWELGVGALIIFIPKRIKFSSHLLWLSIAMIVYASLIYTDKTPFPGTAALAPVLATALAIAALSTWPKPLNVLAQWRPTQWIGDISYPLYLWHWPLLVIPDISFGRPLTITERVFCIAATFLLADLTHRWIEDPIRYSNPPNRLVLRAGALATALSLVLSFAIYLTFDDTIRLGNGKTYQLADVIAKPVVYNDDCHVNNGEITSPRCTYGSLGAAKKIVLFGDSHAAQWFPALEKLGRERKFELISLTKSACPGAAVKKVDTGEYKNSDCNAWRAYAFNRIRDIRPDAVIVSGFQHFEFPREFSSRKVWWQEGQSRTLKKLSGSSPHLIYISDTPKPDRNIPNCLAGGKLSRCNGATKSEAIFIPGFTRLNPTSWLCNRECPGVISGVVAYRDASHISVDMSLALSSKLAEALTAIGVLS